MKLTKDQERQLKQGWKRLDKFWSYLPSLELIEKLQATHALRRRLKKAGKIIILAAALLIPLTASAQLFDTTPRYFPQNGTDRDLDRARGLWERDRRQEQQREFDIQQQRNDDWRLRMNQLELEQRIRELERNR